MRASKHRVVTISLVLLVAAAAVVPGIAVPAERAGASANLLGHWTFDDGTATDISGNGNNGVLNGATPAPGYVGTGSLEFDGVDDHVDLGNLDVVGSAVTLAAWISADNLANCASRDCRIVSKASGTSSSDHYLMLSTIRSGSDIRLRFRLKANGSTSTLVANSGNLVNGQWTHVAATYDGTTMKVFVDGVAAGSKAKSGVIDTNPAVAMWVGGNPPSPTIRPWDGKIDEVRLYDGALTLPEIQVLAGQSPTPDTTPPQRSNGAPFGLLPPGTTQTILSLTTDEVATCRYGTVPGTPFASLSDVFTSTGSAVHVTEVIGLTDGNSYSFYVRCEDTAAPPNANTDDLLISFSIDALPLDTDPPTLVRTAPNGVLPAGTTQTTLSIDTNEPASCRYDTIPGTPYSAMPNTFSTTGFLDHSTLLTGLTGGALEVYVRCEDAAVPPNANPDDLLVLIPVSLGIDAPQQLATLVGAHPFAPLQPTSRGKQISTLFGWGNKLYTGYGDWQENTGPIHIVHYDPVTDQFVDEFTFNTESVQNFRVIDGKLYVPSIDPTSSAQPDIAVRDALGNWTTQRPAGLIHSFDVNTLTGTDLWLVGAAFPDGEVHRSTDGGVTWTQELALPPSTTFARAFYAGVHNNKLYVEPWFGVDRESKVFDGVSWTDGPDLLSAGETGWRTEEFAGSMFLRTQQHPELANRLRRFDGISSEIAIQGIRDFVVTGNRLYVLQDDGTIHYTEDGVTYSTFSSTVDLTYRSIGELNGAIYVGTSLGDIYRFGPPPPDTSPPVRSNGSPAGALPPGTIETTLSLVTDESATCRYGTTPGTDFAALPGTFGTADGIAHSETINGLTDGTALDFYVRCEDSQAPPNVNPDDFAISFSVSTAGTDLVAHWPFDDGTANDVSGNGYNGVINGALPAVGQDDSGALDFDGTSDYVDAGSVDVPGSEVTIAAWINSDNLGNCTSFDCRIVSKASGTSTQDHYLMLSPINSNGGAKLRFRLKAGGSTSTLVAGSGNLVNGQWIHVAATYDGAAMRVFVNGAEVGSVPKSGAINTNPAIPLWIAGNPPSPTIRPFDGKIDDVRIYSRALSLTEIQQLATPVANEAPVGVQDAYAVDEDTVLNVPAAGVLANDTDAEGDPLTAQIFTLPSSGSLTLNPDGSFTYTPDPNFNGQDFFSYQAADALHSSAPTLVTITVDPVNDQPVADPQSVSTDRNVPVPVTLTGSDIDGDGLSFIVTVPPLNGTLSGAAPNLIYTPDPGFVGPDSFLFVADDGLLFSASAVVQIDVLDPNDPPVGVEDQYQVDEGNALNVSAPGVLANDTDPEGDPLTAQIFTLPSNGSLTLNLDGSFTYTPDLGFTGQDFFSYRADDTFLTSAPTLVTITVNEVPAGLIGHWTFDDGTGADSSGNGNDGAVNGAVPDAGRIGAGSLDFDGANDHVDAGNIDVPGNEFTLSAWVNSDNLQNCGRNADCRIASKATGTSTEDHFFMLSTFKSSGSVKLRFRLKIAGSTQTLIASSGTLNTGVWHHVAATYDGIEMKLFLDGVDVGSLAVSGTISVDPTVPFWIGGSPLVATSKPWDGTIDDVRLYNRALSAAEIGQLAAQ